MPINNSIHKEIKYESERRFREWIETEGEKEKEKERESDRKKNR